jgi:hypothetical protein
VYASGLYYMDLNVRKMLIWIGKAVCHSAIVFWIPYGCYAAIEKGWSGHGHADGIAVNGFTTFSCLVWGMTLQVAIQTKTWTWLNHFFIAISVAGWYLFTIIYSLSTFSPEVTGVTLESLSRPSYYLVIILVVGAMILFDLSIELVRTQLYPNAIDIASELSAGHGVPGRNGVVLWGDEETEDDKIRAAATLAAVAASAATGFGAGQGQGQAAPLSSSKNGDGAAVVGISALVVAPPSSTQAGTSGSSHNDNNNTQQPAGTRIADLGASSSASAPPSPPLAATTGAGGGGKKKKGAAVEPPEVPDASGRLPSAAAAQSGGDAVDASRFTSTDGTVYVAPSVVLEGADGDARREMGIVKGAEYSHGYAFNYVSKHNMGEKSVAPVEEEGLDARGTASP